MSETKIIPTTGRNNCGGRCIIYAHVCDGVIEKLSTETKGTPEHPVPLCACAKGLNYHKTFLGEDRLRWPMKRVGERGDPFGGPFADAAHARLRHEPDGPEKLNDETLRH